MIFLYAVAFGLLLGYASGGRLSRLLALDLRALWLVLGALAIQILIYPFFTDEPVIPYGTAILHGVSYAMVFLWLVRNFRVRPLWAIGAGAVLNLLMLLLNRGAMPASPHALRLSGLPDIAAALDRGEAYGNLVGISASTKLNFLGDWVPLPDWLPFARPMSVGDVVVMIGLVWLLVRGMRTHRRGA
jgi:hypothetical protein